MWKRLPDIPAKLQIQIAQRLLRPAVHFALRNGLKIQNLIDMCKRELITAAKDELQNNCQKMTLSNLCISTGLHRADVKRLQQTGPSTNKQTQSISVQIIGQWQGDPQFTNSDGKPNPLTYGFSDSEFNKLCEKITTNFNAAALLTELQRLFVVELSETHVVLKMKEIVFDRDLERGFELLSRDIEDLSAAVGENMAETAPQTHLHRRTEYDNIDSEHLPQISEWIYEQGNEFHARLREYLSQFDADFNPDRLPHKGTRSRISVGSFSFTTELEKEENDSNS